MTICIWGNVSPPLHTRPKSSGNARMSACKLSSCTCCVYLLRVNCSPPFASATSIARKRSGESRRTSVIDTSLARKSGVLVVVRVAFFHRACRPVFSYTSGVALSSSAVRRMCAHYPPAPSAAPLLLSPCTVRCTLSAFTHLSSTAALAVLFLRLPS